MNILEDPELAERRFLSSLFFFPSSFVTYAPNGLDNSFNVNVDIELTTLIRTGKRIDSSTVLVVNGIAEISIKLVTC
jgi:hypothetical protein